MLRCFEIVNVWVSLSLSRSHNLDTQWKIFIDQLCSREIVPFRSRLCYV